MPLCKLTKTDVSEITPEIQETVDKLAEIFSQEVNELALRDFPSGSFDEVSVELARRLVEYGVTVNR